MEKTVAFYTLGCRVNQYETAAMEALFEKENYKIVPFDTAADVYVINTCTVTAESERKCRQILRRAKGKNPKATVAAVGCMAQSSADVLSAMPEVDLVLGVSRKQEIVEAVKNASRMPILVDDISRITEYREMKVNTFEDRDRAFVKIQDGCDRFCSYCIIPYVRGRVRSRAPEDILTEIRLLGEKGFREVVLTGIHVASFGRGTDTTLSEIIRRVAEIDGIERIRLSSIDPTAFDESLLKTYRETDKLCPHFHISLQSGSSSVLRRMNRRYTPEEYAAVTQKLRDIRPDTSITTDIITGFPGETEEEFAETMAFTETAGLCGIHVFPYSVRKGTAAAKMENQVPRGIREARARELIQKAAALRHSFAARFVGCKQPVLFEHGTDKPSGFTPHFLRVEVPEATEKENLAGKILPVLIYDCKGEILYGKKA
ncbi:MAG: tRNA (N(6)-L-threonylcarbamoyladenosine(37)-C(2))-methylthiotransferase MtaB [Ruminococcaceae bacterium]|nr:tRNA (N(6)-L-threonylcarbamoyladenosine(37)-C(2))-methylthiotransferase MtaB [Oscillospiraceae bacterium]